MTMRGDLHSPTVVERSMLSTNSAVLRLHDDDYSGVTVFSNDPALWEAIAEAALRNAEALR